MYSISEQARNFWNLYRSGNTDYALSYNAVMLRISQGQPSLTMPTIRDLTITEKGMSALATKFAGHTCSFYSDQNFIGWDDNIAGVYRTGDFYLVGLVYNKVTREQHILLRTSWFSVTKQEVVSGKAGRYHIQGESRPIHNDVTIPTGLGVSTSLEGILSTYETFLNYWDSQVYLKGKRVTYNDFMDAWKGRLINTDVNRTGNSLDILSEYYRNVFGAYMKIKPLSSGSPEGVKAEDFDMYLEQGPSIKFSDSVTDSALTFTPDDCVDMPISKNRDFNIRMKYLKHTALNIGPYLSTVYFRFDPVLSIPAGAGFPVVLELEVPKYPTPETWTEEQKSKALFAPVYGTESGKTSGVIVSANSKTAYTVIPQFVNSSQVIDFLTLSAQPVIEEQGIQMVGSKSATTSVELDSHFSVNDFDFIGRDYTTLESIVSRYNDLVERQYETEITVPLIPFLEVYDYISIPRVESSSGDYAPIICQVIQKKTKVGQGLMVLTVESKEDLTWSGNW